LLVTGALTAGILGSTIPAQASTVAAPTTTVVPAAAPAAPTAVTAPTVALTPAQVAAAKAARVAAVQRAAAVRVMRVRVKAVKVARSRVGSRYVAGASGPRRFDCSGLALYVVKHSTGRSLPHYSRAQFRATKRISKKQLRPGDLVFFFRRGAHHVGIYIGHGLMVSATNPRTGVKVDAVFTGWYGSRYSGAGRLV
jgi:cell wall-associated NlpC family hydrolase